MFLKIIKSGMGGIETIARLLKIDPDVKATVAIGGLRVTLLNLLNN